MPLSRQDSEHHKDSIRNIKILVTQGYISSESPRNGVNRREITVTLKIQR